MSKIKECFVSRHEDGMIWEMDYAQLEVFGLAVLSKDQQLKDDLKSGIDMHCQNAAKMYGAGYADVKAWYTDPTSAQHKLWKERRSVAKVFSFQLQYGSGARNMAESQGVQVKLAENFIAAYYER